MEIETLDMGRRNYRDAIQLICQKIQYHRSQFVDLFPLK